MHHIYCLTKGVCSVELRKSNCSLSNVSENACVRVAEKVRIQTRRSEIHQQKKDRQTSKGRDKVWDTATHKGLSTSEHWLRLKIKDNVIGVGGQKGAWGPCSVLPQAAGWVLRGGCRGERDRHGITGPPKLRCTSCHPLVPKSCVYSQCLFRDDQVNYRASFYLFLYTVWDSSLRNDNYVIIYSPCVIPFLLCF